jgi:acyl-CoA synthetase (AMP-forming)/AMP-acid ligase II
VAQQHLDRLSAVDAAFLHQEGPTTHMHIGGVIILEGPPPPFAELREHVRSRLAAYQYPRIIEFVAELPMTNSAKVDRAALRRRAAANREA